MSSTMIRKGRARTRASSLALLCLFAHALFVCVTHYHDAQPSAAAVFTTSEHNDSSGAPDSKGDAHCLSCRLQSNFISDAHTNSLIIEPIPQSPTFDIRLSEPPSQIVFLLIFGRAPPLA